MSVLANTQDRIIKTEALIAQEERALAEHPESREAILHSLASLAKIKRQLEHQFAEATNAIGVDICSYRLFSEEGPVRIASLANALLSFQNLISVMYDSIKHKKHKDRARIGADVAAETSLEFGYVFAGSTGFVLTVPNERLLGEIPSHLDETIRAIFELTHAEKPEDIAKRAKDLGHGPIRAVRSWVNRHVEAGFGVEIEWRRKNELHDRLLVQQRELTDLRKTIDASSAETTTCFQDVGELRAVSLERKTFTMRFADGIVGGSFSNAIGEAHTVELPRRYRARIAKTVRVTYSTDEEVATYFLEGLDPA